MSILDALPYNERARAAVVGRARHLAPPTRRRAHGRECECEYADVVVRREATRCARHAAMARAACNDNDAGRRRVRQGEERLDCANDARVDRGEARHRRHDQKCRRGARGFYSNFIDILLKYIVFKNDKLKMIFFFVFQRQPAGDAHNDDVEQPPSSAAHRARLQHARRLHESAQTPRDRRRRGVGRVRERCAQNHPFEY